MWTWVQPHLMSGEFLRGPHTSGPGLKEGAKPLEQMLPLGGTDVSFHITVQSPGGGYVASAQGARELCPLKTRVLLLCLSEERALIGQGYIPSSFQKKRLAST